MTARKAGRRCALCGRRCRFAKDLCATCREAFAPMLAGLRELPARPS